MLDLGRPLCLGLSRRGYPRLRLQLRSSFFYLLVKQTLVLQCSPGTVRGWSTVAGRFVGPLGHWALSDQVQGHGLTLNFSPLITIQTVNSYISALSYVRKL